MPGMKTLGGFAFCILSLVFVQPKVANAQSVATAEGAVQFAQLGDFKLRDGGVINDFRLGYRTLGRLNSARSNGILCPSWLVGTTENLLQFIVPCKVVDTTNYFVVLVDAIGNGV